MPRAARRKRYRFGCYNFGFAYLLKMSFNGHLVKFVTRKVNLEQWPYFDFFSGFDQLSQQPPSIRR